MCNIIIYTDLYNSSGYIFNLTVKCQSFRVSLHFWHRKIIPGIEVTNVPKSFHIVQISNKSDQIISFHLGRPPPPPYSSRSRCQTWTNPSIGSLIQNLPPVQSCELRSPKDWGEDVVQQHSLQLHRAVASCPLSSTNSNNFFLRVMMDPRKIGIKCARHFMTGAEHLLSIFYSGFQCKKAPSPKLHSFPFPCGGGGGGGMGRILSFPASKGLKWGPPSLAWPPTSRDPWIHNNEQMKQSFEATRHHCGGQSDMTDFLTRLSDKMSERKFMSFTSTKAVLRTLWWKFWKKEKLNYIKCPMYQCIPSPQPPNSCCQYWLAS